MQKNMKSQFNASGMTTYFDVGDHVIEVFLSSYTGREIIRIDGQEISRKLNWRYRSDHEFELDGDTYRVEITIISLLKGQSRVDLLKNGEYLDHDEIDWKIMFGGEKRSSATLLVIAGWGVLGGICGYVAMKAILSLFGAGDAA